MQSVLLLSNPSNVLLLQVRAKYHFLILHINLKKFNNPSCTERGIFYTQQIAFFIHTKQGTQTVLLRKIYAFTQTLKYKL